MTIEYSLDIWKLVASYAKDDDLRNLVNCSSTIRESAQAEIYDRIAQCIEDYLPVCVTSPHFIRDKEQHVIAIKCKLAQVPNQFDVIKTDILSRDDCIYKILCLINLRIKNKWQLPSETQVEVLRLTSYYLGRKVVLSKHTMREWSQLFFFIVKQIYSPGQPDDQLYIEVQRKLNTPFVRATFCSIQPTRITVELKGIGKQGSETVKSSMYIETSSTHLKIVEERNRLIKTAIMENDLGLTFMLLGLTENSDKNIILVKLIPFLPLIVEHSNSITSFLIHAFGIDLIKKLDSSALFHKILEKEEQKKNRYASYGYISDEFFRTMPEFIHRLYYKLIEKKDLKSLKILMVHKHWPEFLHHSKSLPHLLPKDPKEMMDSETSFERFASFFSAEEAKAFLTNPSIQKDRYALLPCLIGRNDGTLELLSLEEMGHLRRIVIANDDLTSFKKLVKIEEMLSNTFVNEYIDLMINPPDIPLTIHFSTIFNYFTSHSYRNPQMRIYDTPLIKSRPEELKDMEKCTLLQYLCLGFNIDSANNWRGWHGCLTLTSTPGSISAEDKKVAIEICRYFQKKKSEEAEQIEKTILKEPFNSIEYKFARIKQELAALDENTLAELLEKIITIEDASLNVISNRLEEIFSIMPILPFRKTVKADEKPEPTFKESCRTLIAASWKENPIKAVLVCAVFLLLIIYSLFSTKNAFKEQSK